MNFVGSFSDFLFEIGAVFLIGAALVAVSFFARNKITNPFLLCVLCIAVLAVLVFGTFRQLIVLTLMAVISFAVKCYFTSYDFSKEILSVGQFVKNKPDGRIIGKCLPYKKEQLKDNKKLLSQNDIAAKGGTLIFGASGSGKTYLIKSLIKQDLESGKSVVFINFKGDTQTETEVSEIVPKGVAKYILSFEGANFTYDPLEHLDNNARVEAILNMRKWSMDGSDAHYKTRTQLFLQKTINEFEYKEGNYLYAYYDYIRNLKVDFKEKDAYDTVTTLIELTLTSIVGEMIFKEDPSFSFGSDEQFALIVSISSANKSLGTALSSLILRDLMEVGTYSPYSPILALYIDEFGSSENALICKDILEKGRSCGIATTLSMQDLNQLSITTSEFFADSVLGVSNNFIIFAGGTKRTAEKLGGTQIENIDSLLMSLQKPFQGKPPTAMYISKYPVFGRTGRGEVYKFEPAEIEVKNSTTKKEDEEENKIDQVEEPSSFPKMPVKDIDKSLNLSDIDQIL